MHSIASVFQKGTVAVQCTALHLYSKRELWLVHALQSKERVYHDSHEVAWRITLNMTPWQLAQQLSGNVHALFTARICWRTIGCSRSV